MPASCPGDRRRTSEEARIWTSASTRRRYVELRRLASERRLLYQTEPVGGGHRLSAGVDVELGKNAGEVSGHGSRADEQGLSDLRIGAAGRKQPQHLLLAHGQAFGG